MRIALLSYRSKPTCGGQGVYVRGLSRALAALGHDVEVISGPPYPVLDDGVRLNRMSGLDLWAEDDPFRRPHRSELATPPAWVEYIGMRRGRFSEPLAFSLRARRYLCTRRYDIIHDNQGLGYGLLGLPRLVTTIHHPITIDRESELAVADEQRRAQLMAWYSFIRMQQRVARTIPKILTPARAGRDAVVDWLGVSPERITVTPLGVDHRVFHPDPQRPRIPGRIVTTASADAPIKGLAHLLIALADITRTRRAELHVVGRPRPGGRTEALIAELGIGASIRFHQRISDSDLADLLRSAEVACIPSLFEGFSLPALEAMACGTALVTTTAGALPEVTGPSGECALHVPPGQPAALADALRTVLDQEDLRHRLGARGAARAAGSTWQATAHASVAGYRDLLTMRTARPSISRPGRGTSERGAC